jgi:hypothetical protein
MSTIIMSFVADEDAPRLRAALQGVEGHASRPHVVTWTLESWDA